MNILEKEINRVRREIDNADINIQLEQLHRWLRQLIRLANQEQDGFWCSECGEKFKSPVLRTKHVDETHAENNIKWS